MSATNRKAKRIVNDLYPTPDYTIDSLLEHLDIPDYYKFFEPCKGLGNIYNKIPLAESNKSYAEISEGKDYFKSKGFYSLIITNPPFSLAQEFLTKSLSESHSVWYLLRLNFLGSQKRKKFWELNPPTHLLVLSKRPSFTNKGTDATEYAWFGWDYSDVCLLKPGIHVI